MSDNSVIVFSGHDVQELLAGRELALINLTRTAYQAHAAGATSLPYSTFLHFPENPKARIIGLPAYVGDQFKTAGIKWIASFPDNLNCGMDRASAVIILNSIETGRPEAILEGSVISAKRTAASAALAALTLQDGNAFDTIGMLGCGLISFEILRFLLAACAEIKNVIAYDLSETQAEFFKKKCSVAFPQVDVSIATDVKTVLTNSRLISFATSAAKPHIFDLSSCARGSLILHISLRDLSPATLLAADNVVDDIDHVCRAETSPHLAAQVSGTNDFIRCTLGEILIGQAPARINPDSITIFSPFGLGILDLAVAQYVCKVHAEQEASSSSQYNSGFVLDSFLPRPWRE